MKNKHSRRKIRIRQNNAEKNRRRFVSYRIKKNSLKLGVTNAHETAKDQKLYIESLNHISAPNRFSLIENVDTMISFIQNVQNQYRRRQGVFIVMDKVMEIELDAIVVLLSIMIKFRAQKIPFNGTFPLDQKLKRIVIDSGFLDSLFSKNKIGQYHLQGKSNSMYTKGWRKVDTELSYEIMKDITPSIFGEHRTLKGLHTVLVELMQNSHNHSNIDYRGGNDWWLSVNQKKDKVCFSFIDYGVGIFKSLSNKKEQNTFTNWYNGFKNMVSPPKNNEILRKILAGEMHKTVTNQYFRGKGLPAIMVCFERNQIDELHIITNEVYADIKNDIYKTMNTDFSGTFVYWEISNTSVSHKWIN